MTKEDLNRRFGDPERQKPITPMDLLAAAHLIRDHCNSQPTVEDCKKCIFFNSVFGCNLDQSPDDWDLSDAECRTVDWLDKQYHFTTRHYIDTDEGGD